MSGKASGSEGLPWIRVLWSLKRSNVRGRQTPPVRAKQGRWSRCLKCWRYLNAWWDVVDDAYGFAVGVAR